MKSLDLVNLKINEIEKLFPNCITEQRSAQGIPIKSVDFDVLKQELSDLLVEGQTERYQLDWPGKRESLLAANAPIAKTLRPNREESVNFDKTENLFIEGDNLEALKLLQESYLAKVKMIYIDPPYNTGNDFVYNDVFAKDSNEYLEKSLQKDEEGNRLVANPESKGRYHSDWLSMMHSRLRLARNLLTDDGVIFISIDDNEQANLKRLCDEVFGENNFIAMIPWRKRTAKSDVPMGVSQDYEWILCFSKKAEYQASIEKNTRKYYKSNDFPGREWRIHDLTKQTTASERPNSFFTLVNPRTQEEYPANPDATWRITEDTLSKYLEENRIVFPGDYDFLNISRPVMRYFKDEDMAKAGSYFGRTAVSTFLPQDIVGMSLNGTREITDLFGSKIFSYPKPINLIKYLIEISSYENKETDIVLDFFAGSATVAHAVMQLNAEDGGNRKFIMVQLPEATDEKSEAFKAGYKSIAEISKERICRAGKQILESENIHQDWNRDIGFRVLKTDESNMKDVFYKPYELAQADLLAHIDNVKEDRTPEDLLFQVMLDWGLSLSLPIRIKDIQGKQVYFVAENSLIACFDDGITEALVKELASKQPMRLLFRDNYYANNDVKINAWQLLKQLSPKTELKSI